MTATRSVYERMMDKFLVGDGCWEWIAAKQKGYGAIYKDGKVQRAHRIMYEWLIEPIPDGLVLDHVVCDNRACVNPWHCKPVTDPENIARAYNPAVQGRRDQTHCINGHEFSGDNLIIRPNGCRDCRECGRAAQRRYYQRKKARF